MHTECWSGNLLKDDLFGILERSLQDCIKIYHKQMCCGEMKWIGLFRVGYSD